MPQSGKVHTCGLTRGGFEPVFEVICVSARLEVDPMAFYTPVCIRDIKSVFLMALSIQRISKDRAMD